MNLFNWFGKKESEERSSGLNVDPNLMAAIEGNANRAGVHVNERTVLQIPQLFRAVSIISSKCASLKRIVYQDDGKRKLPIAHPASYLLNVKTNSIYSAHRAIQTLFFDAVLQGNGFGVLFRSSAGIAEELFVISPLYTYLRYLDGKFVYQTTVFVNRDGGIWSPTYVPSPEVSIGTTTKTLFIPAADVFHLRGPGTPLSGFSALTLMSGTYGEAIAVQEFANSLYKNGVIASQAIELPPGGINTKNPENIRAFRRNLEGEHVGPAKAFRALLLTQGAKLAGTVGLSPKDAQIIEARKFTVQQISAATGVPTYLLGDSEGTSQFGNIESRSQDFLQYTISNWLDSFAAEAEQKLLTEQEKDSGEYCIDFDRQKLIQLDVTTHHTVVRDDYEAGLLTEDEAREEFGHEPLPKTESQIPQSAEDLKSTVGGLQAVLALQQAVYAGQIPAEAAEQNLVQVFGFKPDAASKMFPKVEPEKTAVASPPPGPANPPGTAPNASEPPAPTDEPNEQLDAAKEATAERMVKRMVKSLERRNALDDFADYHHDVLLDAMKPFTRDADLLADTLLPALQEELQAATKDQYPQIFERIKNELRS